MLTSELVARVSQWMAEATQVEPRVPDAMQVATVDERGRPSLRTVLLKQWDEDGLVFHTNYSSRKAQQMDSNPHVAALLHCKGLERQLIAEGLVERISASESDAYFATRARGSQLGAWASFQSQEMASRADLNERVKALDLTYRDKPVPRPPNWGGYRLRPYRIEFWQGRPDRLHERHLFVWDGEGWVASELYP